MIQRHGEDLGRLKYENYKNIQKTAGCTLDYYQTKYGAVDGLLKYREVNRKKGTSWNSRENTNYSKVSQELFDIIEKEFPGHTYFAHKNKEFCIRTPGNNYFLDYVNYDLKKVIEFNGDVWHANPKTYKKNDLLFFGKTASEIWSYDIKKHDAIKARGFQLLIIWESDYVKDASKVINDCREFLCN